MLRELVLDILEQRNGFRLGDPWRFSRRSSGVIVPILRDVNFDRDYVTLPEVKDKIEITDTGYIGKVKIKGSDKPVFIRAGSILEGKGTQSRAVEHNVIVETEEEVDVKCVHQSHPISRSSRFEYSGLAPKPVVKALVSTGDQYSVWSSVRSYASYYASRFCDSSAQSYRARANVFVRSDLEEIPSPLRVIQRTDNLVDVKKAIRKLDSTMREILEKVPTFENQVGAIIVSTNGIEGIEIFDHPDSWKAHYKDVIENYECLREELPPLFKIDEEAVFEHIKYFLKRLSEARVDKVNDHTYILRFDDYIGEFTVFNERVIHLFAVKSEDIHISSTSYRESFCTDTSDVRYTTSITTNVYTSPADAAQRAWSTNVAVSSWSTTADNLYDKFKEFIGKRKGFKDVLEVLKEGKKRWKDLEAAIKMSKATLSSRLKNGISLGLVETKFEDGTKYYALTERGKKILKYLSRH